MATDSRFLGNSMEELLVAIAQGVREAQAALDLDPLIDATGRPQATYHLPYLDFTIKVEMTTQTDEGGRPIARLLAAPASGSTTSGTQSTISGRMVAVPPGEGLPLPRIDVTTGGNIGGTAEIAISTKNSAGETLANQRVELNIDAEASAKLSQANGATDFVRLAGTRLEAAVLTTDAAGLATTHLAIDKEQKPRQVVVVTATIGTVSARGVISVEMVG